MSTDSSRVAGTTAPKTTDPATAGTVSYQAATPAQEIRLLSVLSGTMFLTLTSVNMLAPLLLELAAEFRTTVGAIGQLGAAAAIPWAVLAPVMGVLSDRYGRRPVLAIGLIVLGLTTVASAFVSDYTSLLLLRFLSGVGGATTGPNAMAASVEYFPPHRRGRAMGMVLGGLSLATVVGAPATALAAAHFGWRLTFVGVGLLQFGLAAAVWLELPRVPVKISQGSYLSGFAAVLKNRQTLLLLTSNMLERISFVAAMTYLASFIMLSYALRLDQIAPVLSAIAAGTLAGSIFGGRLADRGNQRTQYAVLLTLTAVAAYPLFNATPGLLVTSAVAASFGITGSLARPAWLWMLTRVPAEVRGATTGFAATSNQVGVVIGSSIGGILVGLGSYGAIGLFAASAALGSALVCLMAKRPES